MPATEITKSPSYNRDGSIDRVFVVYDVADDVQAIGLAAAEAALVYRGRNRSTDHPEVRAIGHSIWEVAYRYESISPTGEDANQPDNPTSEDPNDLSAVLEFDTTGGTSHITQCLSQTDHGAESGQQVRDAKVIGASGDSVDGTDIVVPKLVLSLARIPPAINGEYIKSLAGLTGKTNEGPYMIRGQVLGVYCEMFFDEGELMFLGATPTGSSLAAGSKLDGRFVYKFEASQNRVNINLGDGLDGPINVPSKRGHEYLWVMYRKKELTIPAVAIPVPHIAFVSKLQEAKTFAQYLGF